MKPENSSANSSNDRTTQIENFHRLFCQLLPEHHVGLNMHREYQWHEWMRWRKDEPFTPQDLRAVVAYRRHLIQNNRQFPGCLKFHNLIGGPDLFEEDLALARTHRVRRVSDKDRVLESSGRPARAEKPAQLAAPLVNKLMSDLKNAVK